MRFRGVLVCVGVSFGLAVGGCGSQGAEDDLVLTVTPPAVSTSLATTGGATGAAGTPTTSRTLASAVASGFADPGTSLPSADPAPTPGTSASVPTSEVAPTSSPAVGPSFDPRTLPDLPPPDPGTPGPVGGAACSANTSYWNETTDGLDPNVIAAWTAATADAAAVGTVLCLNDGKRSTGQQEQTYQEYVDQYGTGAAQTYVLPPEKSEHVAGYAIDVQPAAAYQWLEQTGGSYGLCRIYEVEPWHFEFRKTYRDSGCPALLPGPVTNY